MTDGYPGLENKIIILDIDHCLLHARVDEKQTQSKRIMRPDKIKDRGNRIIIGLPSSRKHGVEVYYSEKRPHLDAFLSFVSTHCRAVIVWSAGDKKYVNRHTDMLFRGHKQPNAILTRDNVQNEDSEGLDYHKPISVIRELYPEYYNPEQIIFVDDKEDNFRNNTSNGFTIPMFYADARDDTCLANFVEWLKRPDVASCKDVRLLDKSEAFTYMNVKSQEIPVYRFLHKV
jgi:TFIIF-interacting CTD phosphatase-like protein